jgi:flagellar hook-length control protein FliK
MNELANLMLGVLLPGTTTAPPGAQPGAAPTVGDTSGSAFQDLLMQTLEGAEPQVDAGRSWAGQQSSDESTETPKTEVSTADQTKLLGSIDMTSSALAAAQAVQVAPATPVVADPQPRTQAAEPAIEVQAVPVRTSARVEVQSASASADPVREMTPAVQVKAAQSAPADQVSAESVVVSPDQQVTQSGSDVVMASKAQADVPMAQTPDAPTDNTAAAIPDVQLETAAALAAGVQAETPATPVAEDASVAIGAPVIDDPANAVLAQTSNTQVNQTAPDQTVQTAVVSSDAADVRPEPVKGPHHRRQVNHTASAHIETKRADKSDGETTGRDLGLPDVPAPSTGAPAFDYTKLRLNAKLDVKTDDHAALPQVAMPLTRSAVVPATAGDVMAVNPAGTQDKPITGKTVVIPQVAQVSSGIGAVLTEKVTETKQDASQDRKADSLPLTVSDVKPSFDKAVAGAERSQGFQAPERVTEHKMINQIVQSAKLQLVDGGAHMTMRLDPPHLGVLNMSVMAQQGSVVANIETSTEAARHVLQADLSSLKQALADAGITVDSINVSLSNTPNQPGTPNGGQHAHGNSRGTHVGSQFMQELFGAEPEPTVLSSRAQQVAGVFDYRA